MQQFTTAQLIAMAKDAVQEIVRRSTGDEHMQYHESMAQAEAALEDLEAEYEIDGCHRASRRADPIKPWQEWNA